MRTILQEIKRPPSSSRWNIRGVRNGFTIWQANSGKCFYERKDADGVSRWFKAVPKPEGGAR